MDIKIDYKKLAGLVPVVIQDYANDKVLMLGFMNEVALKVTTETMYVTFFSRTRNKLWMKGEQSGNKLEVKEIYTDCDNDSILIKVQAMGPVCHEGTVSCFTKRLI